jgi:uncharacterized membrane protein HdeD (DUF308 family)
LDDLISLLVGGGVVVTVLITIVSIVCALGVPALIVAGIFYFLRQSGKKMEAEN